MASAIAARWPSGVGVHSAPSTEGRQVSLWPAPGRQGAASRARVLGLALAAASAQLRSLLTTAWR